MYFCTTANSRIMATSLQTDRFTNLLNGIEALAGEEWQQFLAQFKKIEQRRRAEEEWPPEERAWVEQARRARLSDEEVDILEDIARKAIRDELSEADVQRRKVIMTKMGKLDVERAEALVQLSNCWKMPVSAIVEKIRLTYPRDLYVS